MTGACSNPALICDDRDACTEDRCDSRSGCSFTPVAPATVERVTFLGRTVLTWSLPAPPAHANTYRGTIPPELLSSRAPNVYDHACFESADLGGDGPAITTDYAVPPRGTAFYYLVSQESDCGEGDLGTDSAGVPRPNNNPCATPP